MSKELSNVAYKKGNFVRYGLWCIVIVLLVIAGVFFAKIIQNGNTVVPDGYAYSIRDEHSSGNVVTYYVYDGKIYTVAEGDDGRKSIMIYDNVETASINYSAEATTEVCDKTECWRQPKALNTIKQMLARKAGREYNGS